VLLRTGLPSEQTEEGLSKPVIHTLSNYFAALIGRIQFFVSIDQNVLDLMLDNISQTSSSVMPIVGVKTGVRPMNCNGS